MSFRPTATQGSRVQANLGTSTPACVTFWPPGDKGAMSLAAMLCPAHALFPSFHHGSAARYAIIAHVVHLVNRDYLAMCGDYYT
jgi:hypothetical protein